MECDPGRWHQRRRLSWVALQNVAFTFDLLKGDGYRGLWKEKPHWFWMPGSRLVMDRVMGQSWGASEREAVVPGQ